MPESQQSGDCTDHRALDARGLVAQSISSELQGLHRPPSTRRSGTARPVYQLGTSKTAPTTEHSMLGDWSYSIATQNSKERTWCLGTGRHTPGDWSISLFNCRRTGKFNFLDLATRLILRLPASSGTTSVRCIWRCISVTEFL